MLNRTINEAKNIFRDKNLLIKYLAILGTALFFASDFRSAIFVRIFEKILPLDNEWIVNIVSFIPLILSLPLILKRKEKTKIFLIIYGICLVYFAISILLHLDSIYYYFRYKYGVQKVFLPTSGLFTFLYLSVLYDKKDYSDLFKVFALSAILLFAITVLQFLAAQHRGYWLYTNYKGLETKITYSLAFGFNASFVANMFLAMYFYCKKKILLMPVAISYAMAIIAGSRMALLLPPAFIGLYFIYLLINFKKYKKELLTALFGLLTIVLVFGGIYTYNSFKYKGIVEKKASETKTIKQKSLKSPPRNISIFKSGEAFKDNGREKIHKLVWKGLKGKEFFGLGAYGDRPFVAKKYIWGHSHGIHVEMLSNLGIFLSVPFVLLLANTFFSMIMKKRTYALIVYFMFVGTSTLLLTSLSFWREFYLWGCLAMAFLVMEKNDYWIIKLINLFRHNKR